MDKQKASVITQKLEVLYPDAKPALKFQNNFELLIAVMLSAQCTDKRVNIVTEKLFKEYGTPEAMLTLSEEELGRKIFSCGLYKSKAAHILSACRDIVEKFGGEVPRTLEELRTLAGVGRKTANVVYSVGMGGDAIAVDTHVFRVANRTGLARGKTPEQVERGLMEILDKNVWSKAHHLLIFHGRNICDSRKPKCASCPIYEECEWAEKTANN